MRSTQKIVCGSGYDEGQTLRRYVSQDGRDPGRLSSSRRSPLQKELKTSFFSDCIRE